VNFKDLKIGQRLALGIAAAALLLAAMVWIAVSRLGQVKEAIDVIADDRLPKIVAVKDMKDNIRARASLVREVVILTEDDDIKRTVAAMGPLRDAYKKLDQQLQDTIKVDAGKVALAKVQKAVAAMVGPTDHVIELGMRNDNAEATKVLLQTVRPLQDDALAALEELSKLEQQSAETFQVQSNDTYRSALALLLGLGAAAVGALVLFGWLLARSIVVPLRQAVEVSRAVADGDLGMQFEAEGRSETSQLLIALKTMQGSLLRVVDNVRRNSESVATASAQIAQGNSDLSSRTEQQASALQQTAASMEQLGSTVKHNADNARQASQLAHGASDVATRGGEIVGSVVQTMKGIDESSKRIADIIGTIDGIAFQTNILALNAAVEAARAGEQGRGFAVVASEVRSLAQRSAEAAKEIKSLIGASVDRVEAGSRLVADAGQTMQEIVGSVQRVSDIIGEITAASSEQSDGIGQINTAVTQLDQMTQQNAALVEESAAAAESLRDQAQRLASVVSTFSLPAAGR